MLEGAAATGALPAMLVRPHLRAQAVGWRGPAVEGAVRNGPRRGGDQVVDGDRSLRSEWANGELDSPRGRGSHREARADPEVL
jgi:hypothetical protein